MITIPLEIGDLILAGKFKNKKIIVKEIGYDEYGLPTVNGRGIMKIRIAKLIPIKESGMPRKKINQKDYQYYIFKDDAILEGFEYKEDAMERKNDMGDSRVKVFSKAYLKTKLNIDPDDNASWGTRSIKEKTDHIIKPWCVYVQRGGESIAVTSDADNIGSANIHQNLIKKFYNKEDAIAFAKPIHDKLTKWKADLTVLKNKNASEREFKKIHLQKSAILSVFRRDAKGQVEENTRSIKENKEYTGVEVPVRIKKIDGTFWIHKVRQSGEEVCVSKTGYKTKDQAERAAMLKGYVLLGTSGEVEEYEFLNPPKANDVKSADYKPKGQKFDYIEEVVRRALREVNKVQSTKIPKGKKKLNELEVTDPDLEAMINEMARISDEMDRLKNELAKLKKLFDPLDDMITKLMEEADAAGERALQTKQVLITIKKKGNPKVEVAAYKERFERLYNRVNGTMKKQEDEWWELHRTFKKIPTTLGIQYKESVLKESGRFKQFIDKVKGFFTKMYAKIFSTGKQVETAVNDLKQFVGQ